MNWAGLFGTEVLRASCGDPKLLKEKKSVDGLESQFPTCRVVFHILILKRVGRETFSPGYLVLLLLHTETEVLLTFGSVKNR